MAKIDDSVKKKVPELRFKGFTDDWEERKLGEFSDVRDGTHASPKYVSQGHPMVTSKNLTHSGLDMTDVSFLTDKDFNEINKRSKVSIGDILFGMIGTIGNPVIVDRDDFAIKNVALIKEKTSNPITNKWLLQYLKSPSFNRFIQKENAGGTQKFIALGLIRDMKLRVPEFEEQQKIGAFFKKIDDTIALHQRKLDLLKEQKKGYLQKMFPKNGAKVPELRFAGFADDWEEYRLEDISEIIDGDRGKNYPSGDDFKNNGHTLFLSAANVTKQGFVFKETQYITKLKSESLGSGKVILNDIILTSRGSIGHIGFYDKKTHEYIPQARINSGMLILRTDKLNSPSFIAQFLKSPWGIKQIKLISFGSAQPQLTKKDIKNFKIILPKMEEQQKIGSFFKQLDDTIAPHQRKLDLLKEQKKGFLQKMFV
ncbi:restriction endonuclease subunit S [Lactococcus petauri]|uniref:Restriction endonuclease subunit S n=3 Tax=Lactococcus petauri TaxID=1940789 RepID=A0AAJ2J042_9LACT|nr:restriction endonuclease subunit S [Lactococcus petauri]MDT2542685.1 restriction endonuclease subunit S [Lactococcus petauri]MDT2667792.1 restriction endonuclease subunit S [Lactococcus petauri]